MATFVLVHGGSEDRDDWSAVGALLAAHGHRELRPRMAPARESTLESHTAPVAAALARCGHGEAVLVGHSYGGLVITLAASIAPDRVGRAVYVDTAYPEPGRSLFDIAAGDGVDLGAAGVPRERPFVTPLSFDHAAWAPIPKTYIRATRSEFLPLGLAARERVLAAADAERWSYREIDATHMAPLLAPELVCRTLEDVAAAA